MQSSKQTKPGRLRRALAFARPHRTAVAFILGLTLLIAAAGSIEPLVLKYIFDQLESGDVLHKILLGVGLLVGLGLISEAVSAVSNWWTWRIRLKIHYSLLEAAVERLHRMPSGYHGTEGVGATMTRLERGIQGFVEGISEIAFKVFPALAFLVFAVIAMLNLDWRLTLVVLAFVPLPAIIAAFAAPTQKRRERVLLDSWARIYSRFNEVLSSLTMVRSFAMEDTEKKRFLNKVDDANGVVVRGVGFDTSVESARNVVVTFARVAAIGYGAWLVTRGDITVGTLVAFLGYVTALFGPVQGLTGVYEAVHKASVAVDQIFDILDAPNPIKDAPNAQEVDSVEGAVSFENITFGYRNSPPVFEGLNLSVEPGETVAIVGPSGAGKTTLMGLMQRFYDPNMGRVLLDGTDVRDVKQRSLRRQIGVVLQESFLFNESVRHNIAYGRPDASLEEIEAAARDANAHDFIKGLDDGYETFVGERGSRFSAGERQRLAIARALLKNPPMLILDEATSALDAESEALVQEALDQLLEDRTAFIIAHRLSTVVRADRIVVLDEGRIIESGNHRELMDLDGYYASLVRQQTRGLLWDEAEIEAPTPEPRRESSVLLDTPKKMKWSVG